MSLLTTISAIQPYDFLAWSVIISAVVIFWRWHLNKENNFDISDLICEHGVLSSSKFMRTGSWAVMSYGFYLLSKTSPENLVAYAPLYGGIWVSARALDKWQQSNMVTIGSTSSKTTSTYTEKKLLENITLTEEQKDSMKQEFYSDK